MEGEQLMVSANATERRLQLACIALILGLFAEGFSLLGRGPIAFLAFVGIGGMLLFLGMLVFLLALVRANGTSA